MTARTPGQDPASAPSAVDRDRLAEVTAAVVDGSVRTPGTPARTTVFDAVQADQDGPVTQALISLTDKHCPVVRRTALTLLGELAFGRRTPWQGPIDAAAARLHDPDPDARRAAAQLLVRAGGAERARTALDELTDPVTRIALANALLHTPDTHCPPGPLRADPLPEIRLLACIEELATAPRERWPALDAQAEAEVAALTAADTDRIRPTGLRWGSALFRRDRERHCYALATRLLAGTAGPYGQRVGVDLARRAFQGWRAAPGTLTPHLVRLLPTAPPDLRDRVVDTLCASRTATRLAADDLTALLPAGDTAADTEWKIACALAVIDDPRAAPYVHARMASGGPPAGAVAAVRGLLRSGTADPGQLVPRLRELLRSDDSGVVYAAASITGDLGPATSARRPPPASPSSSRRSAPSAPHVTHSAPSGPPGGSSAWSPPSAGSGPPPRPRCRCSKGSPGIPGDMRATGRSPSPGSPATAGTSSPTCAPAPQSVATYLTTPPSSDGCSTTAASIRTSPASCGVTSWNGPAPHRCTARSPCGATRARRPPANSSPCCRSTSTTTSSAPSRWTPSPPWGSTHARRCPACVS
ncbi:HEAT repeat domain-containing protein [Streptomyces inhibens]|uniref:HEAT repeat domain-containing protein n=1 Tax=Streptomyces inhibens TaxID=2293571 RepID=UPI000FFBA3D4|nr:HEAT repeat domain-containing protein [Streptomyces inhibens]